MSANDRQVGGDHYKKRGALQHWDVVVAFELDYFQAQITRYVFRWKDKGGVRDLEKAQHFLEKYIELQKTTTVPDGPPHPPERRNYINDDLTPLEPGDRSGS